MHLIQRSEGRKEEGKVKAKLNRHTPSAAHSSSCSWVTQLFYWRILVFLGLPQVRYRPVHCISTGLKEAPSNRALCSYKADDFMILGQKCQGRSMIHTVCPLWDKRHNMMGSIYRVERMIKPWLPSGQERVSKAAPQDFVEHLYFCSLTLSHSQETSHITTDLNWEFSIQVT